MVGPDVLFNLLLELEEKEVSIAVLAGSDQLFAAPPGKLSMRLAGDVRRYRKELIKERKLPQISVPQAVFLVLNGKAEAL